MSLFAETFNIREKSADLIGFEPEFRHCLMSDGNPFSEGLFKRRDRILVMQGPEWRRDWQLALVRHFDRMAVGTFFNRNLSALFAGR